MSVVKERKGVKHCFLFVQLRSFATDTQEDKDHKLYSIHINNSSSHLVRTFTATLLIPFKYCLYSFPYLLSMLTLVLVYIVIWIEAKSNFVSSGLSNVACAGLPNIIRRVITKNFFSYLSCTSVVILAAVAGYDIYFFVQFRDFESAIWLINPFPIAIILFSIINLPLVGLTVYVHGEHIPLPSLTKHTMQRCCCSSYTWIVRLHQFFLLSCLTTLVVFLSFHFLWFLITFLSYPVQVLSTTTYLLPLVFSLSIIPYMVDILLSRKSFEKRILTIGLFLILTLALTLLVLVMYMFSSIVLLYAHTAPAWSGILALLGTGSGGIVLYIIKLASGDPETEESQDSPPTKKLSAVLSPLSRNESIMRSFKNSKMPSNASMSAKNDLVFNFNSVTDFKPVTNVVYSTPPNSPRTNGISRRISNV